jgi:hypothetical protein
MGHGGQSIAGCGVVLIVMGMSITAAGCVAMIALGVVFEMKVDAAEPTALRTVFQVYAPWKPNLDFQTDVAIVYGVDDSFAARVKSWTEQGYAVEMMTGVAWGNYQDYIEGRFDGKSHMDDAQVRRDGTRVMHDPTVPYMVPSQPYRDYLKTKLKAAIDAGASAIYLEEPEFWAFAGYSESFKREFQKYYGEAWQPPHESVTGRYRSDQLKYILYRNTLEELFRYCKTYAREQGKAVRCFVPTHSLISYSYSQMVSPMSSLMSLRDADGYIAQVWTGTARSPNTYRNVTKERTFEMGYFEYAQMVSMVRPTGRTCYLVCDPIEDDPNHGWDDYEANYKRTLVASLMQAEEFHYEVMPWPDRIFEGKYFATEVDARRREDKTNPPVRVGISPQYATVLQTCFNALADMDPRGEIEWDGGPRRIGVLVSDSLMFQRDDPHRSDPRLGNFFGLAMPLLKRGMPAKVVQLETLTNVAAFKDVDVLLMTYEGMKPMKSDYHEVLAAWVRGGGSLVMVDDFKDSYNAAKAWWNSDGNKYNHPAEHLMEKLQDRGKGHVFYSNESPAALTRRVDGDQLVAKLAREALAAAGHGADWRVQSQLVLRRGSYVVAAVVDESVSDMPVTIKGTMVNLFDPELTVRRIRHCRLEAWRSMAIWRKSKIPASWHHRAGFETKLPARRRCCSHRAARVEQRLSRGFCCLGILRPSV